MKRTDCEECVERAQIYLDLAVPVDRRVKDPAAFVEAVTKVANLTHRYHLAAGSLLMPDSERPPA